MNKFNLTFKGELLPGYKAHRVRTAFAELFGIESTDTLDELFSGESVVLRSQLERKEAADLYRKLRDIGADAKLERISEAAQQTLGSRSDGVLDPQPLRPGMNREIRAHGPGHIDQSWAVPSVGNKSARDAKARKREQVQREIQAETAQRQQKQSATSAAPAQDKPAHTQKKQAQRREDRRRDRQERRAVRRQLWQQRLASALAWWREVTSRPTERSPTEQNEVERAASAGRPTGAASRNADSTPSLLSSQAATRLAQDSRRQSQRDERLQAMGARARARADQRQHSPSPVKIAPRREHTDERRPRQPGEPNLYALQPFRVDSEIKTRAKRAHRRATFSWVAAVAGFFLVAICGYQLGIQPRAVNTGPQRVLSADNGKLLIVTASKLLLHDRAGLATGELARSELPLPPGATALLLHEDGTTLWADAATLWQCASEPPGCEPIALPAGTTPSAVARHPLSGNLLVADATASKLLMLTPTGDELHRASLALPAQPRLTLDSGLLHINSANGAAISVYRYEAQAFGSQLDEVLLLPAAAVAAGQTQVDDFVRAGNNWWVVLRNPESGSAGLYRFDSDWQALDAVTLPPGSSTLQLTPWGQKLLLSQPTSASIARYGSDGELQAPLHSPQLDDMVAAQLAATETRRLLLTSGQLMGLLALQLGLIYGALQHLRTRVYRSGKSRGAPPMDAVFEQVRWLPPAAQRAASRSRLLQLAALLSVALVLIAAGLGVSATQMAALMLIAGGVIAALWSLQRAPNGHIGVLDTGLVLVDHNNSYHLGSGAQLQYRRGFLAIEDVVVFTGSRLLPCFAAGELAADVAAHVSTGVKIDRATLLVKLLQSQHPLAHSAVLAGAGVIGAGVLLTL